MNDLSINYIYNMCILTGSSVQGVLHLKHTVNVNCSQMVASAHVQRVELCILVCMVNLITTLCVLLFGKGNWNV